MHPSALKNADIFYKVYATSTELRTVVDIGAQNVNGSIKDVTPAHLKYIGVDFVKANGVDVVLTDPYTLPFDSESVDIVMCNSCLEHSEMFWVLYLEVLRILRPHGLFYINVPSNGHYHRWPVDCWRFYPDSGQALVNWAKRNGLAPVLLESFVSDKYKGIWNDYVAVFLKDESRISSYKNRMADQIHSFTNGTVVGQTKILRFRATPEDQYSLLTAIKCRYWMWRDRRAARKRS